MTQPGLSFEVEKLSVKQVTAKLKRTLREQFGNLWVRGEVSGYKAAASGHLYFNLKEEDTVLPCALYRQHARLLKVPLRDGVVIEARGSIDVYEPRGAYQFIVEYATAAGTGNLQQAFEELKQKLAAEGLFDTARKRPLPRFARRIGIVTSPSGAVLHDLLQILERRAPGLAIQVYPSLVQGAGSVDEVCAGLAYFSQAKWCDVVIVARGGGSLEDLWTFNEERVARAIAACAVPVISAIGHETDFTIADFVADLRASTPSAAAELVTPANQSILDSADTLRGGLDKAIAAHLAALRERALRLGTERPAALLLRRLNVLLQRCDDLDSHQSEILRAQVRRCADTLARSEQALGRESPAQRLASLAQRAHTTAQKLDASFMQRFAQLKEQARLAETRLELLSPMATLARGYAIVQDAQGQLLRDASAVKAGDDVHVRVAQGAFQARVQKPRRTTRGGSSALPS